MNSEWYGDVPDGWESVSLRYLAESTTGGTPNKSNDDFWDGDIPWVSPKDMNSSKIENAEDSITEEAVEQSSTALIPKGSLLVVARSGILKHSIPVSVAEVPVAINQDIRAYTMRNDSVDPKFLQQFIASHQNALLNLWRKQGATVQSLDSDAMAETEFPIPPIEKQRDIADFLDSRTARIDALVEKQERLLNLLDEKSQAVITQAVMRGLDSTVETKSTDVEWLEDIPEHWSSGRLKHLVEPHSPITYGIVQAGPDIEDGVPYIRTSDMSGEQLPRDGYKRTSVEIDEQYSRSQVHPGDLVLAIRATVGKVLMVPDYLPHANLTQGTARIRPGERMNGNYLNYLLSSSLAEQRFHSLSKGATFQEITLGMVRDFSVPVPPLEEQKEITEHIQSDNSQINHLLPKTRRTIDLLKEKRQALITAAVTGQIDVTEEHGEIQDSLV